jgi:hypothetical protein
MFVQVYRGICEESGEEVAMKVVYRHKSNVKACQWQVLRNEVSTCYYSTGSGRIISALLRKHYLYTPALFCRSGVGAPPTTTPRCFMIRDPVYWALSLHLDMHAQALLLSQISHQNIVELKVCCFA